LPGNAPMLSKITLDALNTAILLLDRDCLLLDLNSSAEQLLGHSGRQIRGESLFNLIQADFDSQTLTQFYQSSQTGLIEEAKLNTAAGAVNVNIMVSTLSFPHPEQQQDHLLLEIQRNEHHAHIRKDIELQQQSRVSNHLIRNLAHEIKNPLGGIKGAAQLLERKLPADFSNRYSQIIIHEAERLSELVNRLLLPAEPEGKRWCNPHEIIEKALQLILLQDEHEHELTLVKDYDPSLPDLNIAAGQIQQALLNLLKNAAEAITGHGQITIRTRIVHQHTIGSHQHKQVIRIDIMDNGAGIPDSLIGDIFFPTISGKNSSGLGLSIAQSLVQRHGGIIEVTSDKQLTCFSTYLPLGVTND